MAFSLEVQTGERPADLPGIWKPALAKFGIDIDFPPSFTSDCKTGVLIMKVLSAPAALTRENVTEAASAYFEFWTDEEGFGFSTASGRSTVDFAVQCLCAASLAEHLNAVYVDPQMGQSAIEPSVGSKGDSYDNALAETINGLYKAELIHRRALWKTRESVELATLEWVCWFNHHRLLEPIGHIPPAEAEMNYYRQLSSQAIPA